MKKLASFVLILTTLIPMSMFGDNLKNLWKQLDKSRHKDLPKTELGILAQIVDEAKARKAYGDLLKAELLRAQTTILLSGDSLKAVVAELVREQQAAEGRDEVFAMVYASVLGHIYDHTGGLDDWRALRDEYRKKSLAQPDLLARTKATRFAPVMRMGRNGNLFNDDLLSVVGYEADALATLHDYYEQHGNQSAAMVTALDMMKASERTYYYRGQDIHKCPYAIRLDSLLEKYGHLKVAGEVAVERYKLMEVCDVDDAELVGYINYALKKWGDWPGTNYLRNAYQTLTQPCIDVDMGSSVARSDEQREVVFRTIRNVGEVTMRVSRLNWNTLQGKRYDLNTKEGFGEMRKLIVPGTTEVQTRKYAGTPAWEELKDTFLLRPMAVGTYLVEIFSNDKEMSPVRTLYRVSDLLVVNEELPGEQLRLAVVNAKSGQPVAGAKIRLDFHPRYNSKARTETLTCNDKGETTYKMTDQRQPDQMIPYTESDNYLPGSSAYTSYNYSGKPAKRQEVELLTDRNIYRPGQEVHVAALLYECEEGTRTRVAQRQTVVLRLYDANRKEVESKEVEIDDFGVGSATFQLPAKGLNGVFTIQTDHYGHGYTAFHVDEYKRPTFEVEFPEVNKKYEPGDTVVVRGKARSYAGVPVQGATVKYKITRDRAWWWWRDAGSSRGETLSEGELTTDAQGAFDLEMPMLLPDYAMNSKSSYFYNITAEVEVTDMAGETRWGEMSLPLGNRPTAFSCDMPKRMGRDSLKAVVFTLKNGSGIDIDGTVRYSIDGKDMGTARTNVPTTLTLDAAQAASGKHHLFAACENDTIEHDFVLFSMDDKQPCEETHDWFYQSASVFPSNGAPVFVQVGSSDADTHIFYTILSEGKVLENGTIDQSNAIWTWKSAYKEEYGSGVTLTFAWVKEGKLYRHEASIERPMPDKRLEVSWKTFRDRLTPGQKEEWTLQVTHPDGTPAEAQLMATMYDKSLDQIMMHDWNLDLRLSQNLPSAHWASVSFGTLRYNKVVKQEDLEEFGIERNVFDERLLTLSPWEIENDRFNGFATGGGLGRQVRIRGSRAVMVEESRAMTEPMMMKANVAYDVADMDNAKESSPKRDKAKGNDQVRENLNETAFFYPALVADKNGCVSMKFTLPESITTWKFIGLAHDKDMNFGFLRAEAVAKKDVMVQPNMPRFVRTGDNAQIVARVFNTTSKVLKGNVRMELRDPETDAVVFSDSKPFNLGAEATETVVFNYVPKGDASLLVCRIIASGKNFSDGEQHYLPILPNYEMITNTVPFTQNEPGTLNIDLTKLFPVKDKSNKLTVEYTNNPAWLMVQALPVMGYTTSENVISQASAYYANKLGQYILGQSADMRRTIELWGKEEGAETSLMSNLEKNQELKDILIDETPWVMEAKRESDQKRQLINFFDVDNMSNRLDKNIEMLRKLQNSDGSWSWWPGMMGSPYLTTEVAEMLVRLNAMIGEQSSTRLMLNSAFNFMGAWLVREMKEMQKAEKEGKKNLRPSENAVQYLYVHGLDGRKLPEPVQKAHDYMLKKLENQQAAFTIYGKAIAAVIFAKNKKSEKALLNLESMRQYSVYDEEKGRYYDAHKAGYSWFDYRIPTQVAAIEALQMVQPDDEKTVYEMQRWLLQSKRTQSWDTPINSVNAVYAFLNGRTSILAEKAPTVLSVNGKALATPEGTAGLGYVKTAVTGSDMRTFTAKKTAPGISWGAIYAQFKQPTAEVESSSSGLTVKREYIGGTNLKVGDKVKVRITIRAERDFDFVQVLDKRAACLEPVNQLSGYKWGYYCSPKDYSTNYYFDMMRKGEHVVETEYYVDREGVYETGTCTVQCAYAPEYTARAASTTLNVKR